MTTDYYQRNTATHIDGTPIFRTQEDEASEDYVASLVADAFKCNVRPFGKLAPIDYYAERDGRLVGVLELKTRSHAASHYPTVFLNVRKWLALMLASNGLGVPALFVVRFTDSVRWVRVNDIPVNTVRVAGCSHQVKSRSDIEPVVDVPIECLIMLGGNA